MNYRMVEILLIIAFCLGFWYGVYMLVNWLMGW
jgi:hypothetical protein